MAQIAWALSDDTSSGEEEGLRGLCRRLLQHASVSSDAKSCLEADLARQELSLTSMRTLVQFLNAHEGTGGGQLLHQYLQGGRLAFPASHAVPAAPSEELVQRREYLKLRQEAREYNRMVYGTEQDPRVQEILDAGNHYASARNQLAISANMVMSVLASFAIAYYAGKSFKASSTTVRPPPFATCHLPPFSLPSKNLIPSPPTPLFPPSAWFAACWAPSPSCLSR